MGHYLHYLTRLRTLPHQVLRRLTRSKCSGYATLEPFVVGKRGLEVGGPSPFFAQNGLIPVYGRCSAIHNCNFSGQTIWSNPASAQRFGCRFEEQYVGEACDLSTIPSSKYDFVLASHVLEHVANPLCALREWERVLTPGGVLLVILPDKRATFDHRRPFTPFAHIEADFQNNTQDDDLTHLQELLSLHDIRLDPGVSSWQEFRERCLQNASVRGMHHHVFSPETLILMFAHCGMRVLSISIERPYHIVGFAQKADPSEQEQVRLHDLTFLSEAAEWKRQDPLRGCSALCLSI
jgi:SAM-dependent methyltransferase